MTETHIKTGLKTKLIYMFGLNTMKKSAELHRFTSDMRKAALCSTTEGRFTEKECTNYPREIMNLIIKKYFLGGSGKHTETL